MYYYRTCLYYQIQPRESVARKEIKWAVYYYGVYWNSGSISATSPIQLLTLRANKICCGIIVTMNEITSSISAIAGIRWADRARRINPLMRGFSTIYVVVPVAVLRFSPADLPRMRGSVLCHPRCQASFLQPLRPFWNGSGRLHILNVEVLLHFVWFSKAGLIAATVLFQIHQDLHQQ